MCNIKKEETKCHVCGEVLPTKEELAKHFMEEHPTCNVRLL